MSIRKTSVRTLLAVLLAQALAWCLAAPQTGGGAAAAKGPLEVTYYYLPG